MAISRRQMFSLLVAGLLFGADRSAVQAQYTFTRVVDTSTAFVDFSPVAINAVGDVAFVANRGTGGTATGQAIFRATGTNLTQIADISGTPFFRFSLTAGPTLSATGDVGFYASLDAGGFGIFRGSGGAVTTIATTGTQFTAVGDSPAINPATTDVAFGAGLSPNGAAIVVGSGQGTTTVASTAGGQFTGFADPSINATGQVAFRASTSTGTGVFRVTGQTVATIADSTATFSGFASSTPIAADGTVAFVATLAAGGSGVFKGNGVTVTPVADSSGPYSTFGDLSINALGKVAFVANLDAGGQGIFTGPNPATDKVIQTGDALDGSTVTELEYGRFGLNDAGLVTFEATLADGRKGIYVAVASAPVPEPTGVLLITAAAGAGVGWWRRGVNRRAGRYQVGQ